ncbi:MAG: aminotransferase class I/II-fold pyridoxal phosphate-dependent enzyme, partial [Patescibacteria group bacterium]|nr:aminotransferase class I/II-fold pyridoxal phosphate-dependent enzyme [Patescibacteria group bacterium]
ILVFFDEAYFEFAKRKDYPDTIQLLRKYKNIIVTRTFSKMYGLAGLRIAYGIAEENLIKELESKKLPFSINVMAVPAALAALEDEEFVTKCAALNTIERKNIFNEFKKLGYNTIPTHSNFLYVYFNELNEKESFLEELSQSGFMVRPMDIFGNEKALRISVGTHEQNRKLIDFLVKNQ